MAVVVYAVTLPRCRWMGCQGCTDKSCVDVSLGPSRTNLYLSTNLFARVSIRNVLESPFRSLRTTRSEMIPTVRTPIHGEPFFFSIRGKWRTLRSKVARFRANSKHRCSIRRSNDWHRSENRVLLLFLGARAGKRIFNETRSNR